MISHFCVHAISKYALVQDASVYKTNTIIINPSMTWRENCRDASER